MSVEEINKYLTRRKSRRFKDHDYSHPGAYFFTICTENKECIFGEVIGGITYLNQFGEIAKEEWLKSADIRREIDFDEWIIMPNHLHGIIFINDFYFWDRQLSGKDNSVLIGKSKLIRLPKSLSTFVSGFKAAVSRRINDLRSTPGATVWQNNYNDHVIRDKEDLETKRNYIIENPMRWWEDRLNPVNF